MRDVIEYLYEKARELREFVESAPEIANELLRMAQELEAKAVDLEKNETIRDAALSNGILA